MMYKNLFLAAACAGAFFVSCSDDSSDVAGGAVEDYGLADLDTVFVHDSIIVRDTIKDTVKVVKKDTVKIVKKDTVEVVKKDTVEVVKKDTVEIVKKDSAGGFSGSITGVSQKGPFMKGSDVNIFELDGSKFLRQTGRSFNSTISANDGSFKVKNVALNSNQVHLTVTGSFYPETAPGHTMGKITLRALSEVDGEHSKVNVNLVTHLEYDRVAYLMENVPKMTLSAAKRQAEKEIFAMFHIDASSFGYAEDMDILGADEADAALLAVSILLPTGLSESGITDRLTEMSEDLAEDGKLDAESTLNSIALWAMGQDLRGNFPEFRQNILDWKINTEVPDFEKYVRLFWSVQLGFGECGSESAPVGTVAALDPSFPTTMLGGGVVKIDSKSRYICADSAGVGKLWRLAEGIEKDTAGLGSNYKDGYFYAVVNGEDTAAYVFEKGSFRIARAQEAFLNKGCTLGNEGDTVRAWYSAFVCSDEQWKYDSNLSEGNDLSDVRDTVFYKTIGIGDQLWMAENLRYNDRVEGGSYCAGEDAVDGGNCETLGRIYTWEVASIVCPDGWRLPGKDDWERLIEFVGGEDSAGVLLRATTTWSHPAAGAPALIPGLDEYGFGVLSTGEMDRKRFYVNVGQSAVFWSSSEKDDANAYYFLVGYSSTKAEIESGDKRDYKAVRCVKE